MLHAELINLCQATAIGINREMVNFELGKEIEKDVFRHVSVAQWLSIGALRFDSSWGLRFFSLSHARDKTNTIFI